MHRFDSGIRQGAKMREWAQLTIAREPMLFDCDAKAARAKGGPITNDFLDCVAKDADLDNCIIDTRTHMLKPGWWPAIPGWHHDDVERTREDKQPNYDKRTYTSTHALAVVNADISPTLFLIGNGIEMSDVPLNKIVYGQWHDEIEAMLADKEKAKALQLQTAQDSTVTFFDCNTFHRAQAANASGWRWFGRVTWRHPWKAYRLPTNQVRQQVQVYMEMPNGGW